ncbi:YigZ family protein [Flagellimonas alvinocaridis]|uniref:YigZ family protein n=1 Tax=Flagellimonas alvinocaridis TaxID=2530200 RepID=A0A4S8RWK4_9FLAO|nr:YigZ family protein [Allomuricauda alvinocaridis]THV59719.1 YigZ family protein [Allomuricauda alvinocaridis]
MQEDTFKTIAQPTTELLFKDRKSKFFAQAFPISSEDEVKPIVEELRKKHHTANHVCYAWQLGEKEHTYRANDDGEPNNSAGMPIYGQIQSFGVTNVLITVTRIFGGTKLGVGGLIQAYRAAAQMALEDAKIIKKILTAQFQLHFDYPEMDKVMRGIKQRNLEIVSQKMEIDCRLVISVRESEAEQTLLFFEEMQHVRVKKME